MVFKVASGTMGVTGWRPFLHAHFMPVPILELGKGSFIRMF